MPITPWHSSSPDGTISVRQNLTPMNDNTIYIETTLGNTVSDKAYADTQKDHFFNVSSDLDGRHRWVKMPAFTVEGVPSDPGSPLGTGIDGMMYLRLDSADSARKQGFYRNSDGIYQFIPAYKAGVTGGNITNSYTNVTDVPKNVYGEIFMTSNGAAAIDAEETLQVGYFYSNATIVRAWALTMGIDGSDTQLNLKFANSDTEATDLNIRARANDAASNLTWNYKITWRTL